MSKIGIITFHRTINYGGALQCLSLYKTLESLGADVEFVDYRPWFTEKYRKILSFEELKEKKRLVKKLKFIIACILSYHNKTKGIQSFDKFLSCVKVSKVCTFKTFNPDKYDYIFIGSDQIWNLRITNGFDPMYWATFNRKHSKVIAYGASLGRINELILSNQGKIKTLLNNFDLITLREDYVTDFVNSLGFEGITVCDPTLLAPFDTLSNYAIKPRETRYILVYLLYEEPGMMTAIEQMAKQQNLKVIRIKSQGSMREKKNVVIGVTPAEFLGYLKYADFVVCRSFHATILSTIFQKDFYSFRSDTMDRAENYLNRIGLGSRILSPGDKMTYSTVDYTNITPLMNKIKNDSLQTLKQFIEI